MTRPETPPLEVSTNPNNDCYYPWFHNIGVLIDGVERTDVTYYNVTMNKARFLGDKEMTTMIEVKPFWKHEETRQQRRARERWEAKNGKR